MEIELTEDVRAAIEACHEVKSGANVFRVIVDYISDQPQRGALIKRYYIWLTKDFVADELKLSNSPETEAYCKLALRLAKKKFDQLGEVPSENGLDCSNGRGIIVLTDAEYFVHPAERPLGG